MMSLSDFFDIDDVAHVTYEQFAIGDVVYVEYEQFAIEDYPEFLNDFICRNKIDKFIVRSISKKKCIILNKTSKLVLVLTEDLRKFWVRNYNCKLINSEA